LFKWLLLFVGIYLLYVWVKKKNASPSAIKNPANPTSDMVQKDIEPEVMVPCHYCQVHLPKSDAIFFDGRSYCSESHLNALDEHGWVGSAKWRPSPNYDARSENISPDLVVIHHISLPPGEFKNKDSSQYIIDFFQNRLDVSAHPYFLEIAHQKVSSHFLITRHGELIQFVSTKNKAWHAGVSSFQGREKCNDFSIGIELEGDGASAFTEEQYQALTALVKKLEAIYFNLQFAGHSDIAPERKTDPGIFFDWQKFQKETKISDKNLPFGLSSR
jgi:AmpD protein